MYKNGEHAEPVSDPDSFFKISSKKGPDNENQLLMNTEIWNNENISAITGYTIEMLK